MTCGAKLFLVVLTEDSSTQAHAVLCTLLRRMLLFIEPGCQTQHIEFLPTSQEEADAMKGTNWKSTTSQNYEGRVRLLRYIARRLCQTDTFVIFHIDGDRPWAQRDASENTAKFQQMIVAALPRVAQAGRAHVSAKRTGAPAPGPMEPDIDRLLLLCPFWCIEAWLYQNVELAIMLCRREHQGRHEMALRKWLTETSEIDEIVNPKDKVCLGGNHNVELAKNGFSAAAVYGIGKSFAAAVKTFTQCSPLRDSLQRISVPNQTE